MRTQQASLVLRFLRRSQGAVHRSTAQLSSPSARTYATEHPIDKVVNAAIDSIPDARQAQRDEIAARAQIVFGSKLQGPQRKAQLDAQSRLIAGVLVPPKPEEPDNCCMSGCVNCVWEMYREEYEEWQAKSAEAKAKVAELKTAAAADLAGSMDDDGGGSESNWTKTAKTDMFEGVPIGIRAFMETEKRLKQRHQAGP